MLICLTSPRLARFSPRRRVQISRRSMVCCTLLHIFRLASRCVIRSSTSATTSAR
jgi:hypothetical protein